jgi:integrase
MQKIVVFALFSTRRQEEITLLRWDDLDEDRILVRDMKHPGDKKGNNVYCELQREALAIIETMPRVKPEIRSGTLAVCRCSQSRLAVLPVPNYQACL